VRVLANENIPAAVVDALLSRGHDVKWIRIAAPGARDTTVLEIEQRESRLIVTFDKDFGELAFRAGLPSACRIILLRIPAASPEYLAERVVNSLESRSDWTGYFSVITSDRIRMTAVNRSS
jgi:predicted nuclease of predicted toxin-antitoxin system